MARGATPRWCDGVRREIWVGPARGEGARRQQGDKGRRKAAAAVSIQMNWHDAVAPQFGPHDGDLSTMEWYEKTLKLAAEDDEEREQFEQIIRSWSKQLQLLLEIAASVVSPIS
ncbi:hypothetical protein AB1Y20_015736 [Prymnesium parvum]|uniref:Uncharacterized protein n=1 Tax=Prymnesium parvum TaxID=97485 RepID=A0AB34K1V5_PRYPA